MPLLQIKNKYTFILTKALIFIALSAIWSCQENNKSAKKNTRSAFQDILIQSDSCLHAIAKRQSLQNLFEGGYSEMAFKIVADSLSQMSNVRRVNCARLYIDYGHFEKALQLIEQINDTQVNFEILNIKMLAALNKQDTALSGRIRKAMALAYIKSPSIENRFNYLAISAYHFHNCKKYAKAIKCNLFLLTLVKGTAYQEQFERKIYRRIGNSYNDLVREKIPFHEGREICFKKTLYYYAKEKEILDQQRNSNEVRKGLNLITTAMVLNEDGKTKIIPYYIKALEHLIQYNTKDFILSRNNIYTSIAITQMAGVGIRRKNELSTAVIDSLINLNQHLLDQQTILLLNSNRGLELKEYFNQISQELKLAIYCKDKSHLPNPLELLILSNSSKYPNMYWLEALKNTFSDNYKEAGRTWRILHEMQVIALKENDPKLLMFTQNQLNYLNPKIQQLLKSNKTIQLNKNWLEQTIKKCKKEDLCLIDYQVLFNGEIIQIKIDKTGISTYFISANERVQEKEIKTLIRLMRSDSISTYENIAYSIAQRLRLNNISSKNICICADEYLEKLPFDALVVKKQNAKNWKDLSYLGNQKNISLLPNLNRFNETKKSQLKANINVWYADSDNQTLPFNASLIRYFEDKFNCAANQINIDKNGIHHIISHTHLNEDGGVQFDLNHTKVDIASNDLGCKLTILHGCKSGAGHIIKSEGSLSLVRMFFYNGSNTVIFSNWDADNASSAFMFENFYDLLLKGENTRDALAKAKNSIKNHPQFIDWASPFYWANFQMSGNNLLLGQ